ncbi:unnamed protein product [Diamesa hyperborea]
MYNFVKIQAIFNATVWLGLYPEFSSFIYNEDVKDVHNIHEKYWEMKQHNLMKMNEPKERIVVGFNILLEKYRGIYNEPKCKIINKNIHKICDYDDIAVVWPVHQMPEYLIKCRLLKLSGIFSKSYGSVMIQNGFKYREQFNRMYVHLQSTGIVQRANKRYRTTILKKNYKAKEDYQVELEGVLFEHVQLIFLVYSFIFPLVLIVMIIEILFHWRAMRKTARIEPIRMIEQSLEALNGVDDTEVDFNEVLEVIDLE